MSDNRNLTTATSPDGRGTVCIDTHRVFDSCRDRDCYENTRVYLTAVGEETLAAATNIRARSATVLGAFIGVSEVPFNCGFYQITIKYYVLVELEACLNLGRSQAISGISVLEKNVILYGGEGSVTTFTSDSGGNFCANGLTTNMGNTNPIAIAETVEPIVLGTKTVECGCIPAKCESIELPEEIANALDGPIVIDTEGPRLYIAFGVFSVVRLVRPTQILVQATDYSVPDKECTPTTGENDPCKLFSTLAFPTGRFRSSGCECERTEPIPRRSCGCNR